MTPDEQERADPTGLASRPDIRVSLWFQAHGGHVGVVMMAVAALLFAVALWWMMCGGW